MRRIQLRDAAYRLLLRRLEDQIDPTPADRWPCHHQHFRGQPGSYCARLPPGGGLPAVPFLEDESLWQLLLQHDLPVRHSSRVQVYTSARRSGRVEVGLSWQLREWASLNECQQEPCVPCPHELVRVWRARHRLRAWWQQGTQRATGPELTRLAHALEVPAPALSHQTRTATTFGQLWCWVEQTRGAVLPVPLSGALRECAGVPAPG